MSVVAQGQAFPRQTTIHDNTAFGDTSLFESDPDNLSTEEARAFGVDNFIDLNTFYGDDTRSKDLPNADLSGGQWRTIALARTFCRPAIMRFLYYEYAPDNITQHDFPIN